MVFFKIEIGRVFLPHRIRAAGKDNAFYTVIDFRKMVEGMYLAIDIELPDTARDELRKLRAKVKNEDFFLHGQK